MKLNYVYEKHEVFYVGHLVEFPEYETQGRTIEELEMMLKSLYEDLMTYDDIPSRTPRLNGVLEIS